MRSPMQLVLDLFGPSVQDADPVPQGAPGAPVHTPVAAHAPAAGTPSGPTAAPVPRPGRFAPDQRVAAPDASLAQGPLQVHPLAPAGAQRQVLLLDQWVAWRLVRARRRSIGMTVGPEGLVVRAPNWVPLREIESALQEKARWILAKLQLMQERASLPAVAGQVWAHGARLPFLGGQRLLCLAGHPVPEGQAEAESLRLQLPPQAAASQIREAAEAWLQQQARSWFTERLNHFAPLLGVRWRQLSLSSARTRWGSASRDGHIRLNWRLIQLAPAQIDYVVVHELAHLREMNHSPRFWDVVAEVMPDWPAQRKALRQVALDEPPSGAA